ncbi:hypothetical protein C9374_002282 [Naegleria lovaniensis]|uniref:Glutathione S-transferase n=1 Tax=Naegleria lovaniensis TaxID=51637 RepID=A0AA88GUH3_NAELO|nr:uncharacterized protein C9374_002282 [Naegleria lovaniensis]KAG2386538.1 hypothetical protein C9374_002282 [Naegleria lovaniensis]
MSSSSLKLYGSRLCPFVDRIKLILAFKQVPYENINVNLNMKSKEFLQLTPLGKVPVLVHNNKAIYESAAIYQYVNDVYSNRDLMHQDPYMRAMQRSWTYYCNTRLAPTIYKYMFNQDPTKEAELKQKLEECLLFLENEGLKKMQQANGNKGDFFLGDGNEPSMPDMMYLPFLVRLDILKTFKGFEMGQELSRLKKMYQINTQQDYFKNNKELPTMEEIIKGYTPYVKGELKMKEDWIL